MAENLVFTKENGVARIVIDRQDRKNSLTAGMMNEMIRIFEELQWSRPDEVRFLVIEGKGDFFCAGADLQEMEARGSGDTDSNQRDAMLIAKLFRDLAGLPLPTLAKVRGGALAGGMGILACCDAAVTEEGAIFGTPEVKVGLLPAVISLYIMRKVSLSWLSFMSLSGIMFQAEEARRIGLVHRVFGKESFEEEARAFEETFLGSGPEAMRRMKKLILRNNPLPVRPAEEFAAIQIAEARASEEGQEGLRARKEKRSADWTVRKEIDGG